MQRHPFQADKRAEETLSLRQVSKVLLDGLHDPNSPLSKLRGIRREVIGEIIWEKMLVKNWQIYSDSDFDSDLFI